MSSKFPVVQESASIREEKAKEVNSGGTSQKQITSKCSFGTLELQDPKDIWILVRTNCTYELASYGTLQPEEISVENGFIGHQGVYILCRILRNSCTSCHVLRSALELTAKERCASGNKLVELAPLKPSQLLNSIRSLKLEGVDVAVDDVVRTLLFRSTINLKIVM